MLPMRIAPLRLLAVAAALVALAAPARSLAGLNAGAGDRGVVQGIDQQHIVLKALDGTQASFALFGGTQIRVDGARATYLDVAPGDVADVVADGKGRALLVRAFSGPSAQVVDRGVVTAVAKVSLTIAPDGGGAPVTIAIDRSTKVKLPGAIGRRGQLRPGALVAVTHAPDGPAVVVTVLKRAGA
jgi:hypothetical protein